MTRPALLMLRALAIGGLLLSAWLLWMKGSGQVDSLIGCGSDGSCAKVLGSRWSQVFGVPVSGLALLLHLAVLVLTFRVQRDLLLVTAAVFFGAALWFTGVQWLVVKSLCPWCLASHLISLACASTIVLGLRPRSARPALPAATGVLLVSTLVAAQVLGPRPPTHRMETVPHAIADLPLSGSPRIGSPEAAHTLVEFFDYTCAACRLLSDDLLALTEHPDASVSVILLPVVTPHEHPSDQGHDHHGAEAIGRLALAAWKAKPDTFPDVHRALFQAFPVSANQAKEIVSQQIGQAELETALADPWVSEQFERHLTWLAALSETSDALPKLMIADGQLMHGLARSKQEFRQLVAETLGF